MKKKELEFVSKQGKCKNIFKKTTIEKMWMKDKTKTTNTILKLFHFVFGLRACIRNG